MDSTLVGIGVGVLAGLLVLKLVKGMIKFAVLGIVIIVALALAGVFN